MSINGINSNKSIPINNYNLKTDKNKKEITSKNQNNNSLPQALEKDTFEKSTEEMNNLTYKPQVNKKLTIDDGFKQAGLDFKNATNSDLPQICNDTYTEVMKRFDEWQNKELPKNTETTEV